MRKVLVTTKHRGVFYGECDGDLAETMTLRNARNVVYWAPGTRGFLGLAAAGPAAGSKIGPAVPMLEIAGVTSVAQCTDAAAAAIEAAPWS